MVKQVQSETPALLTKRDAAAFLGCSIRTLDRVLSIPRIRLRGRVMFRRDTLDTWTRQQEVAKS